MGKTPLRIRIAMLLFAFVSMMSLGLQRDNIAEALNRVTLYYQQNIPSLWWNLVQRDQRLGNGTFWWNVFGSSSSFAGAFDNLSVAPVTGLYVAVGPTNASFVGTLYQLVADDTTAWGGYPQGVGSSALPIDSTKIVGQGMLQTNTSNVGPLTAGASAGQSVIDLIECNVTPSTDQTSSTINIVNSQGGSGGTGTVNRDRVDAVGCQFKASSSSVSPTVPTVDAGYVAIGYATVPYNTATITTGMITASPSFYGFAMLNSSGVTPVSQGGTGLASATTGCFGYNGSSYGHLNCFDTAGTGLSQTGTTVSLSTPVSIANGGWALSSAINGCVGGNGSSYAHSNCVDTAGTGLSLTGTTLSVTGNTPQAWINGSSFSSLSVAAKINIVTCTISGGSCSVALGSGAFAGTSTAGCATSSVGSSGAIVTGYTITNSGGTINIYQSGGTGTVAAVCVGY